LELGGSALGVWGRGNGVGKQARWMKGSISVPLIGRGRRGASGGGGETAGDGGELQWLWMFRHWRGEQRGWGGALFQEEEGRRWGRLSFLGRGGVGRPKVVAATPTEGGSSCSYSGKKKMKTDSVFTLLHRGNGSQLRRCWNLGWLKNMARWAGGSLLGRLGRRRPAGWPGQNWSIWADWARLGMNNKKWILDYLAADSNEFKMETWMISSKTFGYSQKMEFRQWFKGLDQVKLNSKFGIFWDRISKLIWKLNSRNMEFRQKEFEVQLRIWHPLSYRGGLGSKMKFKSRNMDSNEFPI
jgi:hypothetical protein